MRRICSLDDATRVREPPGAASITPDASASKSSTHRADSKERNSTRSNSSTRVAASTTNVVASRLSRVKVTTSLHGRAPYGARPVREGLHSRRGPGMHGSVGLVVEAEGVGHDLGGEVV